MTSMNCEEEDKKAETEEDFRRKFITHINQVYYELLKDRTVSLSYSIIVIIIMTIQLLGYIFDKRVNYPFKDSWYSSISSVTSVIQVYTAIEETKNPVLYWLVQYIFFALILFYIIQVIYVDYSITVGKFFVDFPLKLLRNMSSLFFWVLLTPMIENFVSIYSCTNGYHNVDTSLKCWTGIHIFYCIFFTLTLLLLLSIEFLIVIFYNEYRPNVVDCLRRLDTSLELHLLIYRVAVAIMAHFITGDVYCWIMIVVYLLGSLYFLGLYLKNLPFYDPIVSVIYGICVCTYFWSSFNLLLIKALETTEYSGQSIVIAVGTVMIIPLMKNIREWRIQQIFYGNQHDKIEKETELDIYINKLLDLLTNQSRTEVDQLLLLGFMSHHKSECTNSNCPLMKKGNILMLGKECEVDKVNINNPVIVLSLIANLYKIYSKALNFRCMLHICYSHFSFTYMNNIHLAIVELDIAEKMSPTLQQMFAIFRSKKIIEEFLINKYSKASDGTERKSFQNLDVTVVIQFENLSTRLYKAIDKSTNEHVEFWSQLDSLLPDLNILHKLGLSITKCNNQTEIIWKQLYKINPNHHKALRSYGTYLSDIQNDETGLEFVEKAKIFDSTNAIDEHLNDFSIMFADDTAIIVISAGNKETQGKIVKTNAGITNLFKYNSLEVVGHNVNILMPKEIAVCHGHFLDSFFATGKERMLNNEREAYAIHRAGGLICIYTMIKLVPSLKDDILYIGLIRERNKDSTFILTNSLGKIDSMSESLLGQLEVQHNFFKENEVYVQFLFPDLITLEEDENKQLLTKFDTLEGRVEMTFSLPKRFSTMIQDYSKNLNVGIRQDNFEASNDFYVDEADKEKTRDLPLSVKRIARLIYGPNCQEDKFMNTKNILKEVINYDESEKTHNWIVEVKNLNYGDGKCQLKIFRIMNSKLMTDGTSEKYYNARNSPKGIRIQPKTLERLKKVGLDPQSRCSSLAVGTMPNEDFKEIKIANDVMVNYEIKIISESNRQQPDSPKSPKRHDKHEPSDYFDNSRIENEPLVIDTSIINDEKYLQKNDKGLDDQEEVIRSLLKGNNNLDPNATPTKEDKKTETNPLKNANNNDAKLNDEVGSVASRTKSLMKHIKAMRGAVYEQYSPRSVQQLSYVGYFVFLALLIIALLFYLITRSLYSNLELNIANIEHTKNRLIFTTSMGGCTRALIMQNPGTQEGQILTGAYRNGTDYYLDGFEGQDIEGLTSMTYKEWNYYCLEQCAKRSKFAQNGLSTTTYTFSKEARDYINPSQVQVFYKKDTLIADEFNLDCWSSVMGLVIHCLKVKDMPLTEILLSSDSVYYLMYNSISGLLNSIYNSMKYIQKDSEINVENSTTIILTLLIVASTFILVSVLIILRVTLMVTNNKEGILKLFIGIPSRSIKEQLTKCRRYFTTIRDSDKFGEREVDLEEAELEEKDKVKDKKEETKDNMPENEEGKDEAAQLVDEDNKEQEAMNHAHKGKQKKYKPYSRNIIFLILQFAFFVVLFEGYFVAMYVRSSFFLSQMMDLFIELITISSQSFYSGLLYHIFQGCIASNGTSIAQLMNSEIYLKMKLDEYIVTQEDFLKWHSENLDLNKETYNDIFNSLVYNDICSYLYKDTDQFADCSQYHVLQKGLHSASIFYWDTIREYTNSYREQKNGSTNNTFIVNILNSEAIANVERMNKRYFAKVYKTLLDQLNSDLFDNINLEQIIIMVCFIMIFAILLFFYIFLWNLFVESTKNSLWATKCMLGIIPVNTILEVPTIKNFLINSSKGLMINLSSS